MHEAHRLTACVSPAGLHADSQASGQLGSCRAYNVMRSSTEKQSEARRKIPTNPGDVSQAVLTDSVLLVDMTKPVPLNEFLQLRSESLRFADVRTCYFDGDGGLQKVRFT